MAGIHDAFVGPCHGAPEHSSPEMKGRAHLLTRLLSHGQLILLALSIFAASAMRFMFGPVQESVRTSLGFTDQQIALLQGPALAIPLALGAAPMAMLIARYPRSYLLTFALAFALVGNLLTTVVANFGLMFAARFMVGLSMAMVFVATYSMIGDLYEPTRRGRATMLITIGEVAGGPAAFALGAGLMVWTSASYFQLESWRVVLLAMSIPFVAVIPWMLRLREPQSVHAQATASDSVSWWSLWGYHRILIPLLISRIMVWMADTAVMVWGISVFSRRFALSLAETSAMMATILLVSGILGPILAGPLADWCQRRGGPRLTVTVMSGLTALSVPTALFAIAPTALWAGICATALLTAGFMINVMAMAVTNIVLPSNLRSRFVGVQFTAAALCGLGLTPLIVSSLSSALGGEMMLGAAVAIVGVVGSVLGAICFAVSRSHFPAASTEVAMPAALPEGTRVTECR